MKAFACGGTIYPARFVKRSTAADFTILQADADAYCAGISQNFTKEAPISNANTYAGAAGDLIHVHQPGFTGEGQDSTVWLELGGSVTRGSLLMPDANGKGVTATTGKYYGAIADESGSSGEKIRVTPVSGLTA